MKLNISQKDLQINDQKKINFYSDISIDNYNNRFIHVFNPHHNVEARKTYYDNINNTFISEITIDNYGIWSLDEIIIFMSDLTYSNII